MTQPRKIERDKARYDALLIAVNNEADRLELQLRHLRDDRRKAAEDADKLRSDR